jgi:hypothetical protein
MIAFLSANYEEPNSDLTFKELTLRLEDETVSFNTGDPIVDFYLYRKWTAENHEAKQISMITCSSSVDHFFMDSEKYHEKVVLFNSDYSDGEIVSWQEARSRGLEYEGLIKVCVTDEFTSFKQLKEYVKPKVEEWQKVNLQ